jgi:hypothetical protein
MKRLIVLCAGLTSVLALATVQADAPLGASTTGVNHSFLTIDQHSSFTVKDFGPDAGPADVDSGNISYHDFTNGFSYNADVVCVRVFNGNQANFAFQVPPGNPNSGSWIIYGVKDVGEPGTNGDELGIVSTATEANACSFVNSFPIPANQQVTAGNIQVR